MVWYGMKMRIKKKVTENYTRMVTLCGFILNTK